MNRVPIISIVIPAYNVERYIVAAVKSALAQDLDEVEVIVVNDGSTDGTGKLLESISDPRLRVITQVNKGLSEARNTGIRAAAARYIGFLDGDDLWSPDKARMHVEVMQREPDVGITFSHSAYIDENGDSTGRRLIVSCSEPSTVDLIKRNYIGNGSAAIVDAKLFERTGLFDPRAKALEDYDMWVRMTDITGCRARLVPRVLTSYRLHSGSMTQQIDSYYQNGKATMDRRRDAMPHIPRPVWRRAYGEHARITSRRALSSGNRQLAAHYMLRAVRFCPTLIFRDARALANMVFILGSFLLTQGQFDRLEKAVHLYSSRLP